MYAIDRSEVDEVPPEKWNPQQQSLVKTLQTLLPDLTVQGGWDQQARIYFLDDPEDDPKVILSGILPHHPVVDMQGAWRAGMRVPPDTLGIIVTSEAYRHLTIEEIIERKPDMIDRFKESMAEAGYPTAADFDDEAFLKALGSHYYQRVLPNLGPASALPPDMRSELRVGTAITRNGTYVAASQTRDETEVAITVFDIKEVALNLIPTAMYLFLYGLFPDGETEDPIQVVADYLTLKALEDES